MNFNNHSNLKGNHALLSPSNYHWVNYNDEQFRNFFVTSKAKEEGTELHAIAELLIKKKINVEKQRKTFNMYVNDAIGFRMTPEVVLYYSDVCFGTADAISYNRNILRIHDLKTGKTKPSILQLEIYAALFCLEYHIKPHDIKQIILRLYYQDDIIEYEPTPDEISEKMDKVKLASKLYFEFEKEI